MNSAQLSLAPQIVRASAGTGKTTDLALRFIRILAAGERPDRILATTFTRKAAGEIQERLLSRLATAAAGDRAAATLASMLGDPGFTRAKALGLLKLLIEHQHRLSICTLDSFCAQIARSFSLEVGLPPNWRPADDCENSRVRREAIRRLFQRQETVTLANLVRTLHFGSYSQRTHLQIEKDVELLHELYRNSDVSAWEWLTAPKGLSDDEIDELASWFERWEVPKTKEQLPLDAWEKSRCKIVEAVRRRRWDDFLAVPLVCKFTGGESEFAKREIDHSVRDAVGRLFLHAKAYLLGQLAEQTAALYHVLTLYDHEYQRVRAAAGNVSFDDVKHTISVSAVLGGLDQVYYRLDSRIRHLLLDEFQDTSGVDWRIVKPIVDEVLAQAGGERSFFCVGDVKQAIYGWRGGVAEIFASLERAWPQVEIATKKITYRCAAPILDAVNRIFGGIDAAPSLGRYRGAVRRWLDGFEPHATHRTGCDGYVEFRRVVADGDDRRTPMREAALLTRALVDRYPGASIGILTRKNSAVAEMLFELSREDIAVAASEEGGNPLTDSAPVTVILSLLQLIDHPDDSVARFHLRHSPLGTALGVERLSTAEGRRRLGAEYRERLLVDGYGACVREWAAVLMPSCATRDQVRLEQLAELAHRYDGRRTLCVDDFIALVSREKIEYPALAPVRVMTVHRSKGLEFDIVILPELNGSILGRSPGVTAYYADRTKPPVRVAKTPRKSQRSLDARLEEMHRQTIESTVTEALSLLYVALTRGRNALYLIADRPGAREQLSYAKLLEEVLGAGDALVRYSTGNPEWRMEVPRAERRATPPAITDSAEPVVFSGPARRPHPFRERRNPSQLSGAGALDLTRRLSAVSSSGRGRGRALHRCFQEIEWIDRDAPSRAALERSVRALGLRLEEALPVLDDFERAVRRPVIRAALSRDSYPADSVRVYREQPFLISDGGAILSGAFDRLVVIEERGALARIEVLDYKSERVADGSLESLKPLVAHYAPQLKEYCRAARLFFNAGPEVEVCGKIVFLSVDEIVEVSE